MKRRIFVLLAALLLLSGCTARQKPQTATLFAMDTVMELTVYGDAENLQSAESRIRALEQQISVTDPDSAISQINRTGSGTLSGDAAALFSRALELCAYTEGALDISIYPLMQAWGFTTEAHQVPDDAALASLLPLVDYQHISYRSGSVTLPDGMQIDLGSVAKGYIGDSICSALREAGVRSALLNLGGNVQVLGTKPDGSNWRIAVQDPGSDGYLGVLEIADCAVITSGGYERYFEQDGEIYWHILDPRTGYPAKNGLLSVSVAGPDGAACDALSTALFVMGTERAIAFWNAHPEFEMILVTDDGELLITEGLRDCFTPIGAYEGKTVTVIEHD